MVIPFSGHAAMEKNALQCDAGLCLNWWPIVPKLDGWHQDRAQSVHIAANSLAPDGATFVDAVTVMYAKALYKPRMPETKTLDMLVADDKKEFMDNEPGLTIAHAPDIIDADGKKLRSFVFSPKTSGSWERVSYGEEGDFYLIFTISSRSAADLQKAMPDYEKLIRNYKE